MQTADLKAPSGRYSNTDARLEIIPSTPKEYYAHLYDLVPPGGFNHDANAFRAAFADEMFRLQVPVGQADEIFRERQLKLFETHKTSFARGREQAIEEGQWDPIEINNKYEAAINDKSHPLNNDRSTQEMRSRAIFLQDCWIRCMNGEPMSNQKVEEEYRKFKQEGFPTFGDITKQRVTSPASEFSSRSYGDVNEPARRQNGTQIDGQEPSA